jgi:hypothetical protein
MTEPGGRVRDWVARLLLRLAWNRYRAAQRQKQRAERRVKWETNCPWNGWTMCARGWIRDRRRQRCTGCGSLVPSESHPIVRRARD